LLEAGVVDEEEAMGEGSERMEVDSAEMRVSGESQIEIGMEGRWKRSDENEPPSTIARATSFWLDASPTPSFSFSTPTSISFEDAFSSPRTKARGS